MLKVKKFKYLNEIPSLIHKYDNFNNKLNKILGNQIYFTKIDLLNKRISSTNIYDSYFEDLYIDNHKVKKILLKYYANS